MISNFPKPKGYNLGGLRTFQFAPLDSIVSYPAIHDGLITTPLQFKAGKNWLDGYSTPYSLQFSETGKDTPNGIYYAQAIDGVIPGDRLESINAVASAEGNSFVVLVTDANGQKRLVGAHGYPLIFLADYNTGSSRSDSKGFSFQFSGMSIIRAPVYRV